MEQFLLEHAQPGDFTGHYTLVGQKVQKVDLMTWAKWFEQADRQIGLTLLYHAGVKVRVSTVFLGLPSVTLTMQDIPNLFETMVFGGPGDNECWRYPTYAQAVLGHGVMVAKQKAALNFEK